MTEQTYAGETVGKHTADDVIQKFDVNTLTLGEVAMIEQLAECAIGDLADDHAPKGKILMAIAYTVKRRTDPTYTFAMAATVGFSELSAMMGGDDADTEPEGESVPSV